jgi:pseudouridine-5'-phosphate glycosidase
MLRLTNTAIPKMTAYLPTMTSRKRSLPFLLITAYMQELDHASRDGLELHGLNRVRGAEAGVGVGVGVVEDWEEDTKVLNEALDKLSSRATNLWLCSGKQSMPWLMNKILRKLLTSYRRP